MSEELSDQVGTIPCSWASAEGEKPSLPGLGGEGIKSTSIHPPYATLPYLPGTRGRAKRGGMGGGEKGPLTEVMRTFPGRALRFF